jgi:hypothetical protein
MVEVVDIFKNAEHPKGNDNPAVVRSKEVRYTLKVGLITLGSMYNKLMTDEVAGVLVDAIKEFEMSVVDHESIIKDNGGTI